MVGGIDEAVEKAKQKNEEGGEDGCANRLERPPTADGDAPAAGATPSRQGRSRVTPAGHGA
jgi:hypothetical protein